MLLGSFFQIRFVYLNIAHYSCRLHLLQPFTVCLQWFKFDLGLSVRSAVEPPPLCCGTYLVFAPDVSRLWLRRRARCGHWFAATDVVLTRSVLRDAKCDSGCGTAHRSSPEGAMLQVSSSDPGQICADDDDDDDEAAVSDGGFILISMSEVRRTRVFLVTASLSLHSSPCPCRIRA